MIGNTIGAFFDNLATKTRNPFLGTFVFVWLLRNWELVFALFNFDETYTLTDKITWLSEKVAYSNFWKELGWNIVWTFGALIGTYTLINAARAITNLFEKRLTPLIYKWTDYKSLVPKSEYQSVLNRMQELQAKLDNEVQQRLKVQKERDEFEAKLGQYEIEGVIDLTAINKTTEKEEDPSDKMKALFNKHSQETVIRIFDKILRGESFNSVENRDKIIADLLRKSLIKLKERKVYGGGTQFYYELTKDGAESIKMFD